MTVAASGSGGAACDGGSTTDPANCGACGHDCAGGGCVMSACQPVAIANGMTAEGALAIDDSYVYFGCTISLGHQVCKLPLNAGTSDDPTTPVASAAPLTAIAADDGYFLYSFADKTPQVGLWGAGASHVVYDGADAGVASSVTAMAAHSKEFFFAVDPKAGPNILSSDELLEVSAAGTAPAHTTALAYDGTSVFAALQDGSILRFQGGQSQMLATSQSSPVAIATAPSDSSVYWLNSGNMDSAIEFSLKFAQAPSDLKKLNAAPYSLVEVGTTLIYSIAKSGWSCAGGEEIHAYDLLSQSDVVIASLSTCITGLAANDEFVFWISAVGELERLAR